MKKILWFICITLIYTQNNENLLNIRYDDDGWEFQETSSNQSKVYTKEINGLNLNGVKISRTIDFNPQYILDIVLDINNKNVRDTINKQVKIVKLIAVRFCYIFRLIIFQSRKTISYLIQLVSC